MMGNRACQGFLLSALPFFLDPKRQTHQSVHSSVLFLSYALFRKGEKKVTVPVSESRFLSNRKGPLLRTDKRGTYSPLFISSARTTQTPRAYGALCTVTRGDRFSVRD